MSDDTAPGATQDTPTTEQPVEQDVDWRKRYEDLQPEFTRSRQTLTDREALLQHVQENFPDLIAEDDDEPVEEPDDDLDDDDEPPLTRAEIEELKQWRAQVDSERGQTRYEKDLSQLLDGRELSDHGREVVRALTVHGGDNQQALKAAVERWFEISPPAEAEDETDEPKAKKPTPHVPKGGKPSTAVPDFGQMNRDQIDQWMADRVRASDT